MRGLLGDIELALTAIAVVAAVSACAWAHHMIRRHKLGPLLGRWHLGHSLDGQLRTNASWSEDATKVLHPTGHAHPWHWMRRRRRAAIRWAAEIMLALVLCGFVAAPVITLLVLLALGAAGVLLLAWNVAYRIRTWPHERHYVRPLERTLVARLPVAPVSIEVERDGDAVKSVGIEWPPETEINAASQQEVLDAVTTRLAIEAPEAAWKLKGRNRSVVFTQSEPPPLGVSWDDVAEAVRRAAANELVFGMGKHGVIIKAAYSESPHIAIPGASGGGKSNLAAFMLLQEMLRGSLIFNLDAKWISHLWLQDLPNVINCHDIPDLHLALAWLGKELLRRTKAAYYSAGGTGRVRGNVGPRIIVLAEELNYGMPGLKNHWREIRAKGDPKLSPAIEGLQAVSCAGRASDFHEWLIAQLLTVKSTGVEDSTIRANAGIKAMARWDASGWPMAVGKHIPMPPQTTIPGRIQVVTGGGVRETQVPYLHLDDEDEAVAEKAVQWARALAVSGMVAQIPSGDEGIPPQLWPASVIGQSHFSLIPAVQGVPETPRTDSPVMISLRQAVAEETLRFAGRDPLGAARKAAQRPGFPEIRGWDGPAALYYRSELREWQNGKVRVLR